MRKLKLIDLEPHLLKRVTPFDYEHADDVSAADGMIFLCPACYWSNSGHKDRVHAMVVWLLPRPRCWGFEGTDYRDLSIKAGSVSVTIISGCKAHFDIKRGKVDFC